MVGEERRRGRVVRGVGWEGRNRSKLSLTCDQAFSKVCDFLKKQN